MLILYNGCRGGKVVLRLGGPRNEIYCDRAATVSTEEWECPPK